MAVSGQICVVAGHTRGFTRSVVEALLKRGSKVIFTSASAEQGEAEQDRLGQLYGPSKVHCAHTDHRDEPSMELLFQKAIQIFGGVNLMINATAQDNVRLKGGLADLTKLNIQQLDKKVDRLVLENDVNGIKRSARVALKYMGRHNGFGGGTLLNIASPVELQGVDKGGCTVLGTTRGLGLARLVGTHGVKVVTIYQPSIDYPATPLADSDAPVIDPSTPPMSHHAPVIDPATSPMDHTPDIDSATTHLEHHAPVMDPSSPPMHNHAPVMDPSSPPMHNHAPVMDPASPPMDNHAPEMDTADVAHYGYSATYQCDKRREYSREYTGYMALHAADTAPPGTAWKFDAGLKLTQVTPDRLKTCCGIANKMCFWLGCPMADDLQLLHQVTPQTDSNSNKIPSISSPSLEEQDN